MVKNSGLLVLKFNDRRTDPRKKMNAAIFYFTTIYTVNLFFPLCCRREEKLYTSVKVGHSRTSDLFKVWYGVHLRTVTTTFYLHNLSSYYTSPKFFGLKLEGRRAKSFTLEKMVDGLNGWMDGWME